MAGLWYRAGTVSVTNGSKKITGFGSQWATAVIKPKKGHSVHAPDGRIYELDYVESDTVMYVVTAYAGVTATGQAYAIDITRSDTVPAFSRDLAAFTAYAQGQYDSWQQVLTGTGSVTLTGPDGQQIQVPSLSAMQPASASLKALQALTPVANQLPYFTGANVAAMTPLTAFMRTLLDDATAAAVLSTLDIADLYKKRNIIGAVSQSGGVPTGAVVERGSNANGEFVKFADGTLICIASRPLGYAGSSSMLQDTWTLPVPHAAGIGVAMMMAQVTHSGVGKYNRASPSGGAIGGAATAVVMRLWATGSDSFVAGDATTTLPLLFIGRWY